MTIAGDPANPVQQAVGSNWCRCVAAIELTRKADRTYLDGPCGCEGRIRRARVSKDAQFPAKMIAALWLPDSEMAGQKGLMLCARQFTNSLADSSLEEVKAQLKTSLGCCPITTSAKTTSRAATVGLNSRLSAWIATLRASNQQGRILICWADEAEPVGRRSLEHPDPDTRREEGRRLECVEPVTWNPKRKTTAPVE